jgi:hypothetical protein
MRRRAILLAGFAILSLLPTGCMMMDIYDDDEAAHVAEYRRDQPPTAAKPDAMRGAYGGSESTTLNR